jgi:hypothetical protein
MNCPLCGNQMQYGNTTAECLCGNYLFFSILNHKMERYRIGKYVISNFRDDAFNLFYSTIHYRSDNAFIIRLESVYLCPHFMNEKKIQTYLVLI